MNKEFKVGQRVWSKEYKELATVIDDSYFENCRIKFDDGEEHSVFNIDLHQTADDMFEELGFMITSNGEKGIGYLQHKESNTYAFDNKQPIKVSFYKEVKMFSVDIHNNYNCDTLLIHIELHQAIHQKLVELRWIE